MNMVLKIFLSMSFSGALLILLLFCGKRLLKDKISRQWQYYIWLIVILRLLLPFGPEINLMGKTYQAVDQMLSRTAPLSEPQNPSNAPGDVFAPAAGLEPDNENADNPAEELTAAHLFQEITLLLTSHIWLIWLAAALGMLIRKATIYQGFIRYINAGATPVSDTEILDRLSVAAEQAGINKPIELCVNPLISSPLLIGFLHPCIVLPSVEFGEKDFRYIVIHELIHYKRRDMFYKWLTQVTVCLHWFNPLVHLMSREITKACEFSCDEAVLAKTGYDHAQDYGKTLLDAMAAVGRYRENPGSITLSENKQLLKERLSAIMKFKKQSKAVKVVTAALTLCVVLGASFVGVYTVGIAAGNARAISMGVPVYVPDNQPGQMNASSSEVARYYEADSLPLFEISFSRLDESVQKTWLEKLYADGDVAFFSVAVRGLDTNSSLLADYAEKAYADGETAFFSILANCMDETELESWLDRALEDRKWNFQSILFNQLGRNDEFDEQEKKLDEAQRAEYQAAGVTADGKNYYYQGQLVNIFLDIRANKSVYTLNMNPTGAVNIKIIRDMDDKITSVSYMTDAEVTELLKDMSDPDDV